MFAKAYMGRKRRGAAPFNVIATWQNYFGQDQESLRME
jgi:hypothetical protein